MTPAAQQAALAKHLGLDQMFVLKKRGYYYRVNAAGYTSDLRDAWKVTEAVAKKHAYPYDEPVTMHPAPLPDWAGDLNAIAAVEDTLCAGDAGVVFEYRYETEIIHAINRAGKMRMRIRATAPQRLEALLRALYLWDDSL